MKLLIQISFRVLDHKIKTPAWDGHSDGVMFTFIRSGSCFNPFTPQGAYSFVITVLCLIHSLTVRNTKQILLRPVTVTRNIEMKLFSVLALCFMILCVAGKEKANQFCFHSGHLSTCRTQWFTKTSHLLIMKGQARRSSHSEDRQITKLTKHFLTLQLNTFLAWLWSFTPFIIQKTNKLYFQSFAGTHRTCPLRWTQFNATVIWWVAPSSLGIRLKHTAMHWEESWWKSTVLKKMSLCWPSRGKPRLQWGRFGSASTGTRVSRSTSGLISQFQCTLTGLHMNRMDLLRSLAATCTLSDTEALQGTGMTFPVGVFLVCPMVLSARGFLSWQPNIAHDQSRKLNAIWLWDFWLYFNVKVIEGSSLI